MRGGGRRGKGKGKEKGEGKGNKTFGFLQDAFDGAGAAAAGHFDVEFVVMVA